MNPTANLLPSISPEATDKMLAKLAELKAAAALKNSSAPNTLIVHLYVASSLELYIAYMEKLRLAMAAWGNGVSLELPRNLPAYHSVCSCCGAICGEITMLQRHKLLQEPCGKCPPALFNNSGPIVGTYAIETLAKLMHSSKDAVEHNICEALIARRAAYDAIHSPR